MAEQRFCKPLVGGSIPLASSIFHRRSFIPPYPALSLWERRREKQAAEDAVATNSFHIPDQIRDDGRKGRDDGSDDFSAVVPALRRKRHSHFNALKRIVTSIPLGTDDAINDFHATDHFSECRILAIQEQRVSHTDEKL